MKISFVEVKQKLHAHLRI